MKTNDVISTVHIEAEYNTDAFKDASEKKMKLSLSSYSCIAILTNGILWNYLDKSMNNQKVPNFPKEIRENDCFTIIYNVDTLVIKYKEFSYTIQIPKKNLNSLEDVYPFAVLNSGCEICFSEEFKL